MEIKIPPSDIRAEQALLSAIIVDPECRAKVKGELRPEHFYKETHLWLFETIISDSLDLVGIRDQLHKKGLLEKCGGEQYLINLASAGTGSAHSSHYIKIIKDLFTRRKIIEQCQNTIQEASALHGDIDSILPAHHKALTAIELDGCLDVKSGISMENVYDAKKCLAAYKEHIQSYKKNRFITGINQIDRTIRGVSGGEVLFIMARGGTFKTGLLQNFLKSYVAHSAWASVFFSLEMPVAAVTERYHQIIQGSSGKDIEDHYTSELDGANMFVDQLEKQFITALDRVYIVEPQVSIQDVVAYTRLIERHTKQKMGLIGIDYLGLMEGEGRGEYEIVSKLAKDTKKLAKLLNIPFIVISQTSRKAGAGDIEVTLDMGRGSGVIEEAADFILGLWQDGGDLVCKILKNRKGPKGYCWTLDFDKDNFRLGSEAVWWEPKKKEKSWKDSD